MEVLFAENGRDGIELLKHTPDVDAILVDVMMPDIDGYETMHQIRKMRGFKNTPMIALTAKAMKGDREKCIEAGASDYVSKPADTDQLLSLMRIWRYPEFYFAPLQSLCASRYGEVKMAGSILPAIPWS